MENRATVLAVSLSLLAICCARPATAQSITIRLAPGIPSEATAISYVLYGSFGAVGANVAPKPNVKAYRIDAVHDGRVAASIKGVIYATGCEFDTFEADIAEGTTIEKSYECTPLATVSLVGHITRARRFHDRDLEVVIRYVGDWQCRFFELLDCMVPEMELARAPVNENGEFEATIPDFTPEQEMRPRRKAELWVILRDAKTWNLIGTGLRPPTELQTRSVVGLAIKPFYPPPVEFEVMFPSNPSVPHP